MTSPVDPDYGVRIRRQIRLAPRGTEVSIVSRFEKVAGDEIAVAVWSVTQMPAPDYLLARIISDTSLERGFRKMSESPWEGIEWREENVLRIERPIATAAKIGLDADRLVWARDGLCFEQRVTDLQEPFAAYQSGTLAQVYSTKGKADDPKAYVELEFTSPINTLRMGDTVSLTLEWSLRHCPESEDLPALRRE